MKPSCYIPARSGSTVPPSHGGGRSSISSLLILTGGKSATTMSVVGDSTFGGRRGMSSVFGGRGGIESISFFGKSCWCFSSVICSCVKIAETLGGTLGGQARGEGDSSILQK